MRLVLLETTFSVKKLFSATDQAISWYFIRITLWQWEHFPMFLCYSDKKISPTTIIILLIFSVLVLTMAS